jgi:hypothetical protein
MMTRTRSKSPKIPFGKGNKTPKTTKSFTLLSKGNKKHKKSQPFLIALFKKRPKSLLEKGTKPNKSPKIPFQKAPKIPFGKGNKTIQQ